MKLSYRFTLILVMILAVIASPAIADITWAWSFNSEAGYFLTNGSLVENEAPTGNYEIADFCVISSATGGALGSMSNGQYETPVFSTDEPFTFSWNGSSVGQWLHSGQNTFDWHVYGNTDFPSMFDNYGFGFASPNENDPTSAAHFVDDSSLSEGTVTVEVSNFDINECFADITTVPVPAMSVSGNVILVLMLAVFGMYFRRFS